PMIVRISRVKVGNRQAPHAATKNPTPKRWGFLLSEMTISERINRDGSRAALDNGAMSHHN
ncbi:hypothetical protein, partial [Caballeronia sp. LZ024]|uniref:hypothetical protein n=1 Tax=Caballeronia sp. LZ024 TaxID=3038561 RepID=UPI002854A5D3